MGTFTDQVQYLASEQRTARQERQKKAIEKAKKEEAKKQLHFILSSYFTEADVLDYKKTFLELLTDSKKWYIINLITKKEDLEYYLDQIYMQELNNVKKSYLLLFKEKEKELKEELEQNQEQDQEQNQDEKLIDIFKTILIIILSILFYPLVFLVGIIWRLH